MCTHGHRHAYTYNQGLKDSSLSSKSHSSYGRGRIIHWKEEAMRWNQVPQAWLCVYFQEPEVSELKSVQSSNHGIYLASDTQEHAGSGRASSMPRLTVDPQVKSNHHLPYAVASWAVLNWWGMKNHLIVSTCPRSFSISKTWLMFLHGRFPMKP